MASIMKVIETKYYSTFIKYSKYLFRSYTKPAKAVDNRYTKTVLLPQTKFPSRILESSRIETDNYLMEKCGFYDLYNWQRENLKGPDFILHDGPPYANGKPHMGHALNKIIKDITIRSRVIQGQRVHYVPGWDCHGLPIELKCFEGSKQAQSNMTPKEIRHQAQKFAEAAIKEQREEFMSWGIMADWKESGCYFTHKTSYMINQLKQFYKLYEKNLVFRDFKPVYWSPSSKTALAESELEYNPNHKSRCAIIRFLISELSEKLKILEDNPVYALIWTTTPWTLIANQAVVYSDEISYCVAEDQQKHYYILAEDLLTDIICKIGPLNPVLTIKGSDIKELKYAHPITGNMMPFLPANYVSHKIGTGLVHTAPAHGPDDFLTCLANDIPVVSLVDENGCYTTEAGAPFTGVDVLNGGNEIALKSLGDDVLHTENMVHSYPYDWRTKKPVITRASFQWFINTDSLKNKALNALENTSMYPALRQKVVFNSLTHQIIQRPYWCISRQRSWGTPIPVFFYKDTKKVVINEEIIERLCKVFEREGSDCWWVLPVEKLIGKKLIEKLNIDPNNLEKGNDIMDVWFDSGISWSAVLPEGRADLYLEGMDQFNGWFQSSLLTSIALQGVPPFKSIFAHGFTVDKLGMKMSKSLGNIISPNDIVKGKKDQKSKPAYGIDVLRWWVANHGIQHDKIPVTDTTIQDSVDTLQKLRRLLRFLLGGLYPYDTPQEIKAEYLILDKYMLHRLYKYHNVIKDYYDNYEFHNVCKTITYFTVNDVSANYCHLVKDRLYCEEASSPLRIGAVDVIGEILKVLTRSIAPITPHLAEEVWLYHPYNLTSVPLFHSTHSIPDEWNAPDIEKIMEPAFRIKSIINKSYRTGTLEQEITVRANPEFISLISALQAEEVSSTSELCHVLQVSKVTLIPDSSCDSPTVSFKNIEKSLCKRCRKFVESSPNQPCIRCIQILSRYFNK
ncbi:isoleucine--tRNA ligase, mitochondrial [Chelonus insularis]|uniref:isoleucine--tRNA ligase, mitochondrial n=1 Tax=Chelonus insularis TaxID=460826 RepID=UPI001589C05B|nr:isoleucine--tRNA ligase, mitochondrial [Chelonus insularis]